MTQKEIKREYTTLAKIKENADKRIAELQELCRHPHQEGAYCSDCGMWVGHKIESGTTEIL